MKEVNKEKSKVVKNLKVSLKIARLVAPYVIALDIPVGLFKISGKGVPFKLESVKHAPVIMKEFDTLGNESIEKQYSSFNISSNVVRHYTQFTKEDDRTYTRQI